MVIYYGAQYITLVKGFPVGLGTTTTIHFRPLKTLGQEQSTLHLIARRGRHFAFDTPVTELTALDESFSSQYHLITQHVYTISYHIFSKLVASERSG